MRISDWSSDVCSSELVSGGQVSGGHRSGRNGADDPLTIHSALSGAYNFENLLAAVCVGDHFGLSPEVIKKGIETYVPANNRSQEVQQGSNRLILDAYNANPGSMEVALRHLASRPEPKKAAVLGVLFELGDFADHEHAPESG